MSMSWKTGPRILVSSNCITGGLAASLEKLTNPESIVAIHVTSDSDSEIRRKLADEIPKADLVFCTKNNKLCLNLLAELGRENSAVVFPPIYFRAFHPDIVYAWDKNSRKLTETHYNSRIGVWAYQRKLTPHIASELYTEETFKALGFLDAWPSEVKELKKSFSECNLSNEFSEFFLDVKRSGIFMHTINHPRVSAIFSLAKILAKRAGLELNSAAQSTEITDWLNGIVWPMYPPISESLGLGNGSYRFNYSQRNFYLDGIMEYLQFAFGEYKEQGLTPENISVAFADSAESDSILDKLAGLSGK